MKQIKVYHVIFNKTKKDSFFGSIAAIFETYSPIELGVSIHHLWKYKISTNKPYKNDICTIRLGVLRQKKTNRGYKQQYNGTD